MPSGPVSWATSPLDFLVSFHSGCGSVMVRDLTGPSAGTLAFLITDEGQSRPVVLNL